MLLAACGSAMPEADPPSPVRWQSPTRSPSRSFPTREVSLTPTLAPTSTPRTYTVLSGDTFGSIASKFGITVDALTKSNPNVDPNALPIGTVLIIPPPALGSQTPPPSPTPLALLVGPAECYVQPGGGKWCLALVENPGSDPAAGVYLRFSLYESISFDPVAVQEAALPVVVLPAGVRTAAAAFFPPEQAQADIARVELTSAFHAAAPSAVLPSTIIKKESRPLADGLELAVDFTIDAEGIAANRIDAVLVLLDAADRPIGFRVLHLEGSWPAGAAQSLTLNAFALAGKISSHEFILQARAV